MGYDLDTEIQDDFPTVENMNKNTSIAVNTAPYTSPVPANFDQSSSSVMMNTNNMTVGANAYGDFGGIPVNTTANGEMQLSSQTLPPWSYIGNGAVQAWFNNIPIVL